MADPKAPRAKAALRGGLNLAAAGLHLLGPHRYRVSDALANASFALQPARRQAAMRNYQRVFLELGPRQARRLARRSFREYARISLDFVYVHRLPRPRLISLCRGVGFEHALRLRAEGRGGIMVLFHLGTWDAAGAWAHAVGIPLTVVMADEGSRSIQDLVIWARAEMGFRVVLASKSARTVLRTLRGGGFVALLADIPGDTPSLEVEFLGHRTRISAAPSLLAARTGCPLLPVVATRSPSGTYLVEVHPPHYIAPDQDPAQALRPLLAVFERAVSRWPEQWYPFEEGRLVDLAPR
ncbi:MAG: lysophospholipid acyltransferase family protein [Candidatus Dormibacteria bacterium]